MGRRSAHTPEELRQLILDASMKLIESKGLIGFSAREIAKEISYSAGTLYNVFENLDDILLTIQLEMQIEVIRRLEAIPRDMPAEQYFQTFIETYVNASMERLRLWNLFFEHRPAPHVTIPQRMKETLLRFAELMELALAPVVPNANKEAVALGARVLFASIHGITAVAATEKGVRMNPNTVQPFIDTLTSTYIAGLKAR